MRKFTGLLIIALAAAAFAAPSSAQTAVSPEVTPEATADVSQFPLILQFENICYLTPDESAVAVPNDGVYELSDGALRFSLPVEPLDRSPAISFTSDGSRMFVQRDAIYDTVTGREILPLFEVNVGSASDRWLAMPGGIYDLQSGEKIYDMLRERQQGRIFDLWVTPDKDVVFVRFDYPVLGGTLLDLPSGDILQAFEGQVMFDNGLTRMAVMGDALYEVGSGIPLMSLPSGDYLPVFSADGSRLAVYDHDGITLYDATNGELLGQIQSPVTEADLFQWNIHFPVPHLLHIQGDIVVAPGTNEMRITTGHWVYNVHGGDLLFAYEGSQLDYRGGAGRAWYSPDVGIFDPVTGEILVPSPVEPQLSQRGNIVRRGDGEYDPDTFERVITYPPALDGVPRFDDAYRFAALNRRGVFDAKTGELLLPLTGNVLITDDGRYVLSTTRHSCLVYRLPGQ